MPLSQTARPGRPRSPRGAGALPPVVRERSRLCRDSSATGLAQPELREALLQELEACDGQEEVVVEEVEEEEEVEEVEEVEGAGIAATTGDGAGDANAAVCVVAAATAAGAPGLAPPAGAAGNGKQQRVAQAGPGPADGVAEGEAPAPPRAAASSRGPEGPAALLSWLERATGALLGRAGRRQDGQDEEAGPAPRRPGGPDETGWGPEGREAAPAPPPRCWDRAIAAAFNVRQQRWLAAAPAGAPSLLPMEEWMRLYCRRMGWWLPDFPLTPGGPWKPQRRLASSDCGSALSGAEGPEERFDWECEWEEEEPWVVHPPRESAWNNKGAPPPATASSPAAAGPLRGRCGAPSRPGRVGTRRRFLARARAMLTPFAGSHVLHEAHVVRQQLARNRWWNAHLELQRRRQRAQCEAAAAEAAARDAAAAQSPWCSQQGVDAPASGVPADSEPADSEAGAGGAPWRVQKLQLLPRLTGVFRFFSPSAKPAGLGAAVSRQVSSVPSSDALPLALRAWHDARVAGALAAAREGAPDYSYCFEAPEWAWGS